MSKREKEVLLSLIHMYKCMPYLWKRGHKDYTNKEMRAEGFRVLLEIYKTFDESATLKSMKKKLENMRTNYIKELKKVLASQHSGDGEVFVPTLWYFDALSFLDNLSESYHDDPLETNISSADENSSLRTFIIGQKRKMKETSVEKRQTAGNPSTSSQKDDHLEAYGRSIAYQMKDLNEYQTIICQKLISDAIFCAKLNKLNEDSHIATPSSDAAFQQRCIYSPSPPSPDSPKDSIKKII